MEKQEILKCVESRPLTLFLDLDGLIIKHHGNLTKQCTLEPVLLEGSLEKLNEWDKLGYKIILTTGRRESMRKKTEQQLESLGIFYDQLIMGIGGGIRVLINDKKEDSDVPTAIAFSPNRNQGIKDIKI